MSSELPVEVEALTEPRVGPGVPTRKAERRRAGIEARTRD